jgi:methyltransferase family protein
MTNYARLYRLGMTPWEGYGQAASESIAALLDREENERSRVLGRALDLGCGRGQFTPELARRGWNAIGIDNVPAAIDAALRDATDTVTYIVGDVTDLSQLGLGDVDFFLDVGCFQGLRADERRAEGRGVTALANPGATLLMLAFGPSWFQRLAGGASREQVGDSFPDWELIDVRPADAAGLGWPTKRTAPQWYRLRLP